MKQSDVEGSSGFGATAMEENWLLLSLSCSCSAVDSKRTGVLNAAPLSNTKFLAKLVGLDPPDCEAEGVDIGDGVVPVPVGGVPLLDRINCWPNDCSFPKVEDII
jgi:hypothetical protein